MQITVNGELLNMDDTVSIAALLTARGIEPDAVVVECNGKIVPEEERAETLLAEGDVLEILQFVGGG
ncbi:MAG: sulfur carrier protein ThiS [Desulfovibrio sp.]